jgi:endonuclease-3 related protein
MLREIYETLLDHYRGKAPMIWWSIDPLEVIVGAVLVQGSTWKSVEKVLQRFRELKLLDFRKIVEMSDEDLSELVRPTGFTTRRVKYLKAVSQHFLDKANGDLTRYFNRSADGIRRDLLSVPGIGAGTADNIMLYAGNVPIYMVDNYTRRVFVRHGIIGQLAKDAEIQNKIHEELTPIDEPCEAKLYSKFSELITRVGRDFCGKTETKCGECPLLSLLPERVLTTNDSTENIVVRKSEAAKPCSVVSSLPDESALDETERSILKQLGEEPMPIDVLTETLNLPVHIVRGTIAALQMKKFVKQTEGNTVRRV